MTWFKVDDNFWSHPKTVALSTHAVALWVRAGSYCGNHLTDGVIPRYILPMLQGDADAATELVGAGLWLDHIDGWVFHDWEQYQPARAKVEAERAKTRERVAKHRAKESDTSILEEEQPVPDPTRPRIRVSNGVTPDVTFDDFWSAYPRKAGKGAAKTAWTKAVSKASAAHIIAAAERYRDDPNREDGFTAHAATWLNGERWDDDPLPSRAQSSPAMQRHRRNLEFLATLDEEPRQMSDLELAYLADQKAIQS
jgi:hypothetical protein